MKTGPFSFGSDCLLNRVSAAAIGMFLSVVSQTSQAVEKPATDLPETPVSFRKDVMPVFFRANCNSGGCHGAAAGKDGFRLSLFGYDPEGDHFRITQQIVGRRVDMARPERSLLLLKATQEVPHSGGKLFSKDSRLYGTVLEWIRQGARDDGDSVPQVTGISVSPALMRFEGKDRNARLRVEATYSDGTRRDVTALSLFMTNNKTVADIDAEGVVQGGARGATQVFARFNKYTEAVEVVALPQDAEGQWPSDARPTGVLDQHVFQRLSELRMTPAGLCSDAEFLRRATFDLIGLPPTAEECRNFFADTRPDKRARVVDALLQRSEYADVWATEWAGWLKLIGDTNSGSGTDHKAAYAYFEWLVEQFRNNVPLNEFVRRQVASKGSTFLQPETNLYTMLPDAGASPKAIAQDVAQLFTGIRIQCAECHNHPFDRWTMDDYYGFVSFFTGLRRKVASEPREFYIYNDPAAAPAKHLLDERPVPAKFLGGAEAPAGLGEPRAVLAEWLTASENTLFSRNMANRIWAHFFGRGIVDPIDDFRVTNPPSNGPLLEALARRLVELGYDQKKLIREIVLSRTYQASARTNASNREDDRFFSRALVRRLSAVQALDAVSMATGVATRFAGLPPGLRAAQVYEGGRRRRDYFLAVFGQSERLTVCADEDSREPAFAQALHLMNGETVMRKVETSPVVSSLVQRGAPMQEIVTELYLRTLGRNPSVEELKSIEQISGSKPQRRDYEHLWWALFNSTEFLFQH
jgi:hypothetical protein